MYKLKVISGGQTGVDIAGLDAAKKAGLETGGWMTRDWRTLAGSKPEYQELYGMWEHESSNYKDRTWQNIADSDATIRIASLFSSAGEQCTLNGIKFHKKRHLDVRAKTNLNGLTIAKLKYSLSRDMSEVGNWIIQNDIHVLNVAGNSEQTSPGIYDAAFSFLYGVFFCINSASQGPTNDSTL